jgi:hypothetical protein
MGLDTASKHEESDDLEDPAVAVVDRRTLATGAAAVAPRVRGTRKIAWRPGQTTER